MVALLALAPPLFRRSAVAALPHTPLGGKYVCNGSVAIKGVPVDEAAAYLVTMHSFLATGGDNCTVFNLGASQLGGRR